VDAEDVACTARSVIANAIITTSAMSFTRDRLSVPISLEAMTVPFRRVGDLLTPPRR
jgi:hypothetical protein